jgi:hypothetical protein
MEGQGGGESQGVADPLFKNAITIFTMLATFWKKYLRFL